MKSEIEVAVSVAGAPTARQVTRWLDQLLAAAPAPKKKGLGRLLEKDDKEDGRSSFWSSRED